MRRILLLAILLVASLQILPACGQPVVDAAGVLAFTRIQGVTYILLADHPNSERGWGTFGGHREEGESPEEAAWREFIEETRCIYGDLPRVDLTLAPRVTQGPFVSYVNARHGSSMNGGRGYGFHSSFLNGFWKKENRTVVSASPVPMSRRDLPTNSGSPPQP
jgi:hypothetical protein